MWERRYRIVFPHRSASGFRLYDDGQLDRLREMAAQVNGGVPASRAAQAILDAAASWPRPEAGGHTGDDLVAAAATLDPLTLDNVIGRAFARADFDEVATGWLQPQITALGDAWADGRLTVAQEHFASAGLMRAIGAVFDAAPPASGAAVLVGLPPRERHELALYAFAACLRRRGVNVIYLGADVPATDWVSAAVESHARAAVIGVSARRAGPKAQEVADQLGALTPPVSVWAGGSHRDLVEGVHQLPDPVSEAAAVLHLSLTTGRA
ncbi:B12 binding domain-containing protein [Tessaracoccus flavus]|nr:cobalamin B12-binding domain-containing protein [Tessaracoccus flavus]SDY76278.1 B12 binding domain-containing protein [Tessaracoccus flavus]